jgi:DNA (cytosine-5)-methyltransferase 1
VGYVENNDYCQKIIAQRIKDGYLPEAPIFGDIRAFLSEGFAASYQGMVDVVSGGFPCQPFSVAGKRKGDLDERNLWPDTLACIRIVQPAFCLLENVPGLLAHPYFGTILRDLAESGYDARWKVISAAELGAPHRRDRLWIMAIATSGGWGTRGAESEGQQGRAGIDSAGSLADSDRNRAGERHRSYTLGSQPGKVSGRGDQADSQDQSTNLDDSNIVADSEKRKNHERGRENMGQAQTGGQSGNSATGSSGEVGNPASIGRKQTRGTRPRRAGLENASTWWNQDPADGPVESRVDRVVTGCPDRVDRLRALGNMQVPAVVRAAWKILTEDFS